VEGELGQALEAWGDGMAKIGIVGGGIAGLYCAWKLIDKHSVTLYEHQKRLGGRIETHDLKGFKAECGPMRFELEIEPLFKELADALQIEFENFPSTNPGSAEFPKYVLQSNERSTADKQAEKMLGQGLHSELVSGMLSHHTSALDLLKYGIYRMLHRNPTDLELSLADIVSGNETSKISQYADSLWNKQDKDDKHYNDIRTKQDFDGLPLHQLGFWNALLRVLSPGAVAKIREAGTFYHLLPENPSASEWSIFWLRLFRSDAGLSTVKAGVETIVQRLEAKLRLSANRPSIQDGKTIEAISEQTGKLRLRTAEDGVLPEEFDHVILAIPAVPLQNLSETFPARYGGTWMP